MSVIKRSGLYGEYYGSTYDSSSPLTQEQMEVNARYIYGYLSDEGFTVNAIAGILGNLQRESTLNPGRWQNDDVGNTSLGYGLVQWTPATNYIEWANNLGPNTDPSEMDNNIGRMMYERRNGLQYIPTSSYPETFDEFAQSTKSPEYLTTAFLKNYERAGDEALQERIDNANYWYSFLTGTEPPEGGDGGDTGDDTGGSVSGKRKRFNFVLFNRRRSIYG